MHGVRRHDLFINQGAAFNERYTWSEGEELKDLTGWVAHAEIRTHFGAPDAFDLTPYLTITEGQSVDLDIPGHATRLLTTNGVWDLFMEPEDGDDSRTEKLLYGRVIIAPAVTKGPAHHHHPDEGATP